MKTMLQGETDLIEKEEKKIRLKERKKIIKAFFPIILAIAVITAFIIITFAYAGNKEKKIPKVESKAPVKKGEIFGVGSEWVYRLSIPTTMTIKITKEVNINKNKALVYSVFTDQDSSNYLLQVHNEKGLFVAGAGNEETSVTFQPLVTSFKYPLKIGNHWKTSYIRSDQPDLKWVSETRITDYKKIKVPAGEFECYRIDHKTYLENSPEDAVISTDWYSPKVGLVMQISEASHYGVLVKELVKYRIKEEQK
jgi:hypothetical protein